MTRQQKKANERFLRQIATMTRMYYWPNEGHLYYIEEGNFIASDIRAYDDIINITPRSFHNKVRLR